MSKFSKIGWTHHTWNPWWGCEKVSTECTLCYIGGIMKRAGREPFNGPIRTARATWKRAHRWNRIAAKQKTRFRIFTNSMSDFFHDGADDWRDDAWNVIRECKNLDFLILTKRIDDVPDRLPDDWGDGYDNVCLGVTCGHPSSLWRLPLLREIPAKRRFVSAEPLLAPVDFTPHLDGSIHWIITGCEQAAVGKRRLMDIAWVKDIDKQCREAGIAHYFKQAYDIVGGKEVGTPNDKPLLDGKVVQKFPTLAV